MPRYEYKCPVCETIEEKDVKLAERNYLYRCEVCNSTLDKIFSVCAFEVKGQGSYINDYKKPESRKSK